MDKDIMTKEFWDALLIRAIHAVWETAVATLPAGIVITPAMIAQFNWSTAKGWFIAFLAWALSAIFAGVLSAIKSTKVGMPEVQLENTSNMSDDECIEPDDNIMDEEGDE